MLSCIAVCLAVSTRVDAALIGFDAGTGNVYSISETNASLTYLSNSTVNLGALEYAGDGLLYGIEFGTQHIYTLNPFTGETRLQFAGASTSFEGGLAFASDTVAYATNGGNTRSTELLRIDLSARSVTVVGVISGGNHDINGLTWRSDNTLVGLDRVSNALLEIDVTTAASSLLMALGDTVGSVGGMTSDGVSGYFNTAGNGGSNALYAFDLYSGNYNLIGSFDPVISGNGISGLTLAPIPLPASIWLFGSGLLGLLGCRLKKR